MDPEGIAGVCNLVATTVKAGPVETEIYTRSALVIHFSLLAHKLVLKDKAVGVVAGFGRVCFVAVRV